MEPYEGVSARCALCDGEIYRGEEYYHINGQAVCRAASGQRRAGGV